MKHGFVTHIESELNLDVDFGLSESERKRFLLDNAFSNEYSYREVDKNNFKVGVTHRVRLRGIEKIQNKGRKEQRLIVEAINEFRNAIDRCGGFVDYHITGIDVFGRVITDLFDPVSKKRLNDIFLQSKYSRIFKKYVRRQA